ncbi:glutamate decarboxylase [Blumeria hordei DH14]|uniref:Glutamate decarboxylase n=1 Tax=Blumeria graminis f. sp. hordei (strain DH14) TaxID=546991 RepID=N1J8S2_BLUG1|nr:glutamate decarboxylase [Blumeria hordei DH14]
MESNHYASGEPQGQPDHASELEDLLHAVQALIIPFVRSADESVACKSMTGSVPVAPGASVRTSLVESLSPDVLRETMNFNLPLTGQGKVGLLRAIEQVLHYSVNTGDQGFMDKLYAGTSPVGVVSELVLAILNTNVHVFKVSPALSVIEKLTAKALAVQFGFDGPDSGGISTQSGSASNATSIVIARNCLYPSTKKEGNASLKLVIFTSTDGHYSLEKAAQVCGLGSDNVCLVPSDSDGRMIPEELDRLVQIVKAEGRTPFYVNATAGTTVLGSYDPVEAISLVCKKHHLWLHVDASWGGPVIFSRRLKYKMSGSHLADSLAINPHKMMGVPVTCSFLLTPDLRRFHSANSIAADYLFHTESTRSEVWDLAELTIQCGRRADSLKLALSWIYYGTEGFEQQIEYAFSVAAYMAAQIESNPHFHLVSENPPPCLQVCFYYTGSAGPSTSKNLNEQMTSCLAERLVPRGFMVDYAPGKWGSFLRVVVNRETRIATVDSLLKMIEEIGSTIVIK